MYTLAITLGFVVPEVLLSPLIFVWVVPEVAALAITWGTIVPEVLVSSLKFVGSFPK